MNDRYSRPVNSSSGTNENEDYFQAFYDNCDRRRSFPPHPYLLPRYTGDQVLNPKFATANEPSSRHSIFPKSHSATHQNVPSAASGVPPLSESRSLNSNPCPTSESSSSTCARSMFSELPNLHQKDSSSNHAANKTNPIPMPSTDETSRSSMKAMSESSIPFPLHKTTDLALDENGRLPAPHHPDASTLLDNGCAATPSTALGDIANGSKGYVASSESSDSNGNDSGNIWHSRPYTEAGNKVPLKKRIKLDENGDHSTLDK